MLGCKPVRPARIEDSSAGCTEPHGGLIQGDGAQESGHSNESAVLLNPVADARENHERSEPEEKFPSEEVTLLPKHRIFLSHSGAQKQFVEQLCEDLENAGHFPLFDRRPESLPKG